MDRQGFKTTRREFLKTAGVGGAALAAGAAFPTAVHAQKREIYILTEENLPTSVAFFKKALREFEGKHAGVTIKDEHLFYEVQLQRAGQLIAAGQFPDVMDTGTLDAAQWAKRGLLEPVTDIVNEIGGFDPASRLIIGGQDYIVPANRNFVYYWYREDLFEKAKASVPRTWDQWLDVSAKVTQGDVKAVMVFTNPKSISAAGILAGFAWSNGVRLSNVTPDGRFEVVMDQGANLEGLAETLGFLKKLYHYSPETGAWDWPQILPAYAAGKIAVAPWWGARIIEYLRVNAPQLAPVTKVMGVPYAKVPKGFQWQEGWSVFKTKNTAVAKDLVRFLSTGRTYLEFLWSVPLHLIPAKREVLRSAEYQSHPFIKDRPDIVKAVDSMWEMNRDLMFDFEGNTYREERAAFWSEGVLPQMKASHILAGKDAKTLVRDGAAIVRKAIKEKYS